MPITAKSTLRALAAMERHCYFLSFCLFVCFHHPQHYPYKSKLLVCILGYYLNQIWDNPKSFGSLTSRLARNPNQETLQKQPCACSLQSAWASAGTDAPHQALGVGEKSALPLCCPMPHRERYTRKTSFITLGDPQVNR